jgi:hypothetical protein
MSRKWVMYGALILVGVVFAGRIRALPVLGKLPSV